MPNIIPPIVSSTPPPLDPIGDDNEEDEDEFGDFTTADYAIGDEMSAPREFMGEPWKLLSPIANQNSFDVLPHENGTSLKTAQSTLTTGNSLHDDVSDEDEENGQHADNTSQESVVSGVTDSGNCSASQNSNIPSPMPHSDPDHDLSGRKQGCSELNNHEGCHELDQTMGRVESSATDSTNLCALNFSPNSEAKTQSPAIDIINDSSFKRDQVNCTDSILPDTSVELVQEDLDLNFSDFLSQSCDKQVPKVSSDGVISSISGLGVEFESGGDNIISNEETTNIDMVNEQVKASVTLYEGNMKTMPSDAQDSEEDEAVRAMIVPDIPITDDSSFSSETQVSHSIFQTDFNDTNVFPAFDSPSRRPTLVLSDVSAPSFEQFPSDYEDQDVSKSSKLNDESVPPADITFSSSNSSVVKNPVNGQSEAILEKVSITEVDDEFADFAQAQASFSGDLTGGEWAEVCTSQTLVPSCSISEADDFTDFESAEFQTDETSRDLPVNGVLSFNFDIVKPQLSTIFKDLFPMAEGMAEYSGSHGVGSGLSGIALDVEDSPVWQGLRDLEATPSLSFQWPGSHSNRGLLESLNIDSRNILFGPKWNTVVPRFAANLGFSPLEPVRAVHTQLPPEPSSHVEAEHLEPHIESVNKSSPSISEFQENVPAAQFDWSDSGLVNPLDSIKNQGGAALATTIASGYPALASSPQIQLMASAGGSERNVRDPKLSPEAVRILDSLPELAFLSARMLMFPVQSESNVHKL